MRKIKALIHPLFFTGIVLFFCVCNSNAQQSVIRLWPDGAPGSENWKQKEQTMIYPGSDIMMVQNVTDPTLRLYAPVDGKANGTAIIVAPGGAFETIVEGLEGMPVAEQLNAKGITVFLLRYRIFETIVDFVNKPGKVSGFPSWDKRKVLFENELKPMVLADAQQAVKYVRQHASEYGIDPHRIGFMGFSAGGTVTSLITFKYDSLSRPDFSVPVYGAIMNDDPVPADAPPLFLVHAGDDATVPVANSIGLYNKWKASAHDAEMHIYSNGGHGFGGIKHNLPVDTWVDRLYDWLALKGFVK